ncbi:MAG: acetate--CoA ligase family protein [Alphaproteobacteria bacterium]
MSSDIDLESLRPLFRPRSVAVIGASASPEKIGGRPLAYLLNGAFDGPVWPVNPTYAEVQGQKAYASVADLPETPDMVVVSVPAPMVVETVEQCADRGVGSAIIFSSGFAEIGEEGAKAQARLGEIARNRGIRIVGPNCLGVCHFERGMMASFAPIFAEPYLAGGRIGIVSQSGAFGAWAYDLARERNLAPSFWATTGNEVDVDFGDCLAFLAEDPETKVILAYMEGCRNGPKLIRALEMARARRKPLVIVKVGRTDVGALAAASHTAALAGGDAVYDAVFAQGGAYRADDLDEFFDVAYACAISPLASAANDRIALVTVSGGVGVLMADASVKNGLDVAPLPDAAQAQIKQRVPFAGTRNPLDVTGQIVNDRALLGYAIDLVLSAGDYGGLSAFQGTIARSPAYAEPNLEMWRAVRARHPYAALSVCGKTLPQIREGLEQIGVMAYEEPGRAIRGHAALGHFRRAFDQAPRQVAAPAPVELPTGPWTEAAALNVLSKAGVPAVPHRVVASAEEAAAAFADLGGPVVVKLLSSTVTHKSDVGGVRLNLATPQAAADAVRDVLAIPGAEGALMAKMAGQGVEIILGIQNDPVFGPLVMVGLGGVFVEVMGDVSLRVCPVDEADARQMIGDLKGAALLKGVRGRPPADIDALAGAIAALSRFAVATADRVGSVDINPFLVLPEGEGAVALDAVLVER